MNLLHSNDQLGVYPPSWYAATSIAAPPRQVLCQDITTHVCIIGAGLTGLSAALHLAEAGFNVTVLEAHRVGFGASGRNGGQLGSGQRLRQTALENILGHNDAYHLWALAEDAKKLVKSLIEKHDIDCQLTSGIAEAGSNAKQTQKLHSYAEFLREKYDYHSIKPLTSDELHDLCPSPAYHGGLLDNDAGHLHPLNFVLGLATAAENAGAKIYELSEVTEISEGISPTIYVRKHHVVADYVILACNGYLGNLNQQISSHVMPINNYIIATEPLGQHVDRILTQNIAVCDTKFVLNYFRLSQDKRLLFGGGESYGFQFPSDIASLVRKPLLKIFPSLSHIRIDYAWGGTLAITKSRMPYVVRLNSNIISASGFSGHGLGIATHAGQLMAMAIAGQSEGFNVMEKIPSSPFPGGLHLRSSLLALALTWYALRDKLGI